MKKETRQTIMGASILVAAILIYSYINYNKRSKQIDLIEKFATQRGLLKIWNLREFQLNIFDWILGDKQGINYVFVDTSNVVEENKKSYLVNITTWSKPVILEDAKFKSIRREENNFYVITKDVLGAPIEADTLNINEIENTNVKRVDDWINHKLK